MSASSRFDPIPNKIGPYKIETELDQGGISTLYLGIDPKSRAPIAVKTLLAKFVSNPQMVQQFMHEAEIIEITNHPNIVRLFGHGEWEEGVYIATEFIQGISLRQMILQQAMSLKRALEIVIQIGHALTHLHVHGIIHRDLKPENILLTAQGGVKVVDFGISQLYTNPSDRGGLAGTPAYMAPEQQKAVGEVTFSSDIFALGVITYELILGRLSHGSIHLSMMPKNMQPVLAKALQPDPAKRYEDIVDFVKALSEYYKSDLVKADMRGSDYMGELNEEIRSSQEKLIPSKTPTWPQISVGFKTNVNMALSAVYYDFFHQKEGVYNILLAQSERTGVEGVMQMALLKGIVHTIATAEGDPRRLLSFVNERLIDLDEKVKISCAFLSLRPVKGQIAFIALDAPPLIHISSGGQKLQELNSQNPPLGVKRNLELIEVDRKWEKGDKAILHNFQAADDTDQATKKDAEQHFLEALKEHLLLPPKQQAEAVVRRLLSNRKTHKLEQAVTLISCARGG